VGAHLVTVDHHHGSEENQPGWEYHDQALVDSRTGRLDTLPTFRRNLDDHLADVVSPVLATTQLVARWWTVPVRLLFLDGNHTEEVAQHDFHAFAPHVVPGGLLLFSTFGPDTLKELRAAFAEIDRMPHVSRFIDMHDIGDALLASGFRDPVLERDDFTLTYADARDLMRELRAIGATNADAQRRRSLTGKAHLARVIGAYERFRSNGFLPATYEVVYAIARAPEPGQPRRHAGEDIASFPIERLRGSRRR
jgi:hypothetical protein